MNQFNSFAAIANQDARIRELEEKVVELREYLHTENERIAKAREILEPLVSTVHGKPVMRAIAILQGQGEMMLSEKDEARRWMETADRLQREMGDLNERIAKAQEILQDAIHAENETHLASIASALAALEGK